MTTVLSKPEGLAATPADFQWWRKSIPCQAACPTHTDIPKYLALIHQGEFAAAYAVNVRDNVFPDILGRVCTRPCESECRHGEPGLGESVAICTSKRASGDHRPGEEMVTLSELFPESGKRVAVVGGGVAGMTCARELSRRGHRVTLHEEAAALGGMALLAIPAFRLPRDVVHREAGQAVVSDDIEVKCNNSIRDTHALKGLSEAFDAVVMATGAQVPRQCGCAGEDLPQVIPGLDFLLRANRGEVGNLGKHVVVIGGGFTAVDCARVALRHGAESVNLIYRREREHMALTPGEYEELIDEGATTTFKVAPSAFLPHEGGRILAQFSRTRSEGPSGSALAVEPGIAMEVVADAVIVAVGQSPDTAWIQEVCSDQSDSAPGATAFETRCGGNVFLAGDCATGPRSLIEAIAHARCCVADVDHFLCGERRTDEALKIVSGRDESRTRNMDALPRHALPTLPVDQRVLDSEVETGFAPTDASSEASRCYLCHYKYEIDTDACIYCDLCCKVKPRENCIVKAAAFQRDPVGAIESWTPKRDDYDPEHQFEYHINSADCIRCNACLEVCPVSCISVQKVSLEAQCEASRLVAEHPNPISDATEGQG
ncbi:MAG: FAD-dependent oxidoreductase [Verrucomicrobia bacterium]|nr:FAD-dependent oxidoreductase [Verrucomicrobiota bacterium]